MPPGYCYATTGHPPKSAFLSSTQSAPLLGADTQRLESVQKSTRTPRILEIVGFECGQNRRGIYSSLIKTAGAASREGSFVCLLFCGSLLLIALQQRFSRAHGDHKRLTFTLTFCRSGAIVVTHSN